MISTDSRDSFVSTLKGYILSRLGLPSNVREDDLSRLVVFSVRMKMPGADPVFIEEKMAGTDCHQISYVAQKKVLLMMEIERNLGVVVDWDSVESPQTVEQYGNILWSAMNADK